MKKETNVVVLSSQVLEKLQELGLSESSLILNGGVLQAICSYHGQHGKADYDAQVMAQFKTFIEDQLALGEFSRSRYNSLARGAMLLEEYVLKGELEWKYRPIGPKTKLSSYYENLLNEFIGEQKLSPGTVKSMSSMLRKYLAFLEKQGHTDIETITSDDISQFIISSGNSGRSLLSLRSYMKKFHSFLQDSKGLNIKFEDVLSFPVSVHIKAGAYTSQTELSQILKQIDTTTAIGKRDYAIFLLAATTGLRGSDILNLKLEDINWRRFEVRISQQKTKGHLSLPILPDTGEAIKDYILHGRPNSDSEHIFLRARAPYQRISKSVSVLQALRKYQSLAGIEFSPFDGKGVHSLRRGMGRNLLMSGASVDMIAQVLGQKSIESTTPYLPLDSNNMKECTIDLSGIEISKGVFGNA